MVEEYLMHLSFKEVLTIALTIIALAITIYAFFVYKLLSKTFRDQARSEANETMLTHGAKMLIYIGFVYWENYEITNEDKYLDIAIDVTEDAYNDYAKNLKESEHEYLICKLKNNLAYYYAVRGKSEDGAKARQYAEDILAQSPKFDSSFKDGIINTYQCVQQGFPKTQLDNYLKISNRENKRRDEK
jgi:hypothetical protein